MKKILIVSSACALGLCAVGLAVGNRFQAKEAKADTTQSTLAALLSEYATEKSQQYTKKSTIFVDTSKEDFSADYFHAGNTQFQRTTYYDEKIGALLMGDLNGGFSSINSGYANDGENMKHFSAAGEAGVAALTDSTLRSVDYTVFGKTMADYFYNLSDLSAAVAACSDGAWTYSDSTYTYNIDSLVVDENGDYKDPLLKGFQYFAAPMLLMHKSSDTSHYLSPSSITVTESNGVLSVKIYAASDVGKLYSEGGLLAEARVYKGIVMPGYYAIGSFSNWEFDTENKLGYGNGQNYAVRENFTISISGGVKVVQLADNGYFGQWFGSGDNDLFLGSGVYNLYASKDGNLYADQQTAYSFQVYLEENIGDVYVYLYDNTVTPNPYKAEFPGQLVTSLPTSSNNYFIDYNGYNQVIFSVYRNSVKARQVETTISSITGGGVSIKSTTWDGDTKTWMGMHYWGSAAGVYDVANGD